MRKVEWWEYKRDEKGVYVRDETGGYEKVRGKGMFRRFGIDYEEFENGPGNYSTAIIELQDGTIKNIPVENIKFVESDKDNLQERLREIIQGPTQ